MPSLSSRGISVWMLEYKILKYKNIVVKWLRKLSLWYEPLPRFDQITNDLFSFGFYSQEGIFTFWTILDGICIALAQLWPEVLSIKWWILTLLMMFAAFMNVTCSANLAIITIRDVAKGRRMGYAPRGFSDPPVEATEAPTEVTKSVRKPTKKNTSGQSLGPSGPARKTGLSGVPVTVKVIIHDPSEYQGPSQLPGALWISGALWAALCSSGALWLSGGPPNYQGPLWTPGTLWSSGPLWLTGPSQLSGALWISGALMGSFRVLGPSRKIVDQMRGLFNFG